MIRTLIPLLAMIILPYAACSRDVYIPGDAQINEWWHDSNRKKPGEKFDLIEIARIGLKSGETAFLASVWFPERGRSMSRGSLLIRPALKETRDTETGSITFKVYDLDRDGISEISMFVGGMFMHGCKPGHKAIYQFDGWHPVLLHKRWFDDNLGDCGTDSGRDKPLDCFIIEVDWVFKDLDGDGIADLLEFISESEGVDSDKMTESIAVHRFLFKNKQFILTSPEKIESRRLRFKGR
jgi:hypothetical protein